MKNRQITKLASFLIFISIFCQTFPISLAKTSKNTTRTPSTITKTQKATKSKLPIIKNGDLSDKILISEVFPNPKGTDTGKEWIELINKEHRDINLGNWSITISNSAKSTKPKIIKFTNKDIIKANSYLTIDSANYKFSLLNKNCKIELKDFVGKSINTRKYENSEESLSLSLINIFNTNKNFTTWTTPTKGIANTNYYEISGEIQKKNISTDKNIPSSIQIINSTNKPLIINFSSKNNSGLIDGTLKEKDKALFLVEKNKEGAYSLIDFKITNKASQNTNKSKDTEKWIYYSIIPIISGLIWLFKNTFSLHRIVKNLRNIRSG